MKRAGITTNAERGLAFKLDAMRNSNSIITHNEVCRSFAEVVIQAYSRGEVSEWVYLKALRLLNKTHDELVLSKVRKFKSKEKSK